MHDHTRLELLGKTGDDAVGEAYDKIAKHLGLGYPGGPLIDALAAEVTDNSLRFPKLLAGDHSYRFSYSGLKTAVITHLRHHPDTDPALLVHAFQESALEILARRAFAAAREYGVRDILVAGGVSANRRLRRLFADEAADRFNVHFAAPVLCTDNGAMIAGLGYRHYISQDFADYTADVYARA
jgi:N6-L-threonylcarbamoyladenine synthase